MRDMAVKTVNLEAELRAIDALAHPERWADGAAVLLEHLGFVLINASHPGAPAGTHLLVALRDAPTLRHFDAEAIRFFALDDEGKVRLATIDRACLALRGCEAKPMLWGRLEIVDRLGVDNRFLAFGGQIRIAEVDPSLTVLDVRSSGPIVRWGGHSQGSDWLAGAIGAFFGRLILAVNFQRGAEARLAATLPRVLYATFLAEAGPRLEQIMRRLGLQRGATAWIRRETERVRAVDPLTWAAGEAMLAELDLGPAEAPED